MSDQGDRRFSKKPARKDTGAPRPPADAPRGTKPDGRDDAGASERIAKRLARAGVASRRDAEEMIAAGRVSVNGKVLSSPAVNVRFDDRILVDGADIPAIERTRLFLFHKPAGTVTTNRDPEGRKTIFDIFPPGLPRLMSIGRLDIATEGLLLMTNDGGLARALELPATGWLRRYRVRVHGKVDEQALAGLKDGMAVDGVYYGAVEATLDRVQGSNAWLTMGLREGKNREIRNILSALGLDVTRLIRVSYGPFQLAELAEGELREIKGATLRQQLGPRLIAQSGANFEAPLLTPFSSKPDQRKEPREPKVGQRKDGPGKPPAGGPRRRRETPRDEALERLQTRPPRKGTGAQSSKADRKPASAGRKDSQERAGPGGSQKSSVPARSRASHVWMAPGAKPLGEKKKAQQVQRTDGRRYAGKPRPAGPRKPKGKG